ncbi:stage V sporulation protein S [Acidiferrimicrobium sp. IK]|nr:stage V sporulation protein S [Acidiferrimicrobium sp. IK]
MTEILKVSSRSTPNAVAGALAGMVRNHGVAEVQVVGAGALNQAIKAVAIARGYVAPSGLDLHCRPTFADIEIDGQSRTAIRLLVETDRVEDRAPLDLTGVDVPGVDLTAADPVDPGQVGPDRVGAHQVGAHQVGAHQVAPPLATDPAPPAPGGAQPAVPAPSSR